MEDWSEIATPDILISRLQLALRGLGGAGANPSTGVAGVGACPYFNPFSTGTTGNVRTNGPAGQLPGGGLSFGLENLTQRAASKDAALLFVLYRSLRMNQRGNIGAGPSIWPNTANPSRS